MRDLYFINITLDRILKIWYYYSIPSYMGFFILLMKFAKKTIKRWKKVDKILLILLLVFAFEFVLPHIALANSLQDVQVYDSLYNEFNEPEQVKFLPQAENIEYKKVIYVTVTAYSSTEDQTDNTPCITANGYDVCFNNNEDVIAANFLPFGTKVRMPYEFGEDRYFYVQDRMNERYSYRVDIWMKSREEAKAFGVKRLRVEIY